MQAINVYPFVPRTKPALVNSFEWDANYPEFPQGNYAIHGVTRDASGNPLGNCTVDVFETATNLFRRSVVSDVNGNFTFNVTAGLQFYLVAYLAGSPDVTGATVNTLIGTQNLVPGPTIGPSYLLTQSFEVAGTPSGWTISGGSVTFGNSSSPLEGAGDLKLVGSAADTYGTWSGPVDECWSVCMFKALALPASTTNLIGLDDAGATNGLSAIQLGSTGTLKGLVNGTIYASSGADILANTLYYVKQHFKKGAGANSQASLEFSTTGNWLGSGNLFVSTSSGAATTQASVMEFSDAGGGTQEFRFDHVRVSATDLGNFSNWT